MSDLSDTEHAVMDILWRMPIHTPYFKPPEQLKAELSKIDEVAKWAQQLTDRKVRESYVKWLEFFKERHIAELAKRERETRVNKLLQSIPEFPGTRR